MPSRRVFRRLGKFAAEGDAGAAAALVAEGLPDGRQSRRGGCLAVVPSGIATPPGLLVVASPYLLGSLADHLGLHAAFAIEPVLIGACAILLLAGLRLGRRFPYAG